MRRNTTTNRPRTALPFTAAALLALTGVGGLAGCARGPTPTSGTQGLPRDRLAVVRVPQHGCLHEWNGNAVHVDKFYVGGVEYAVAGDREFLVSPGPHTFMVDYGRCVHGLGVAPDDGVFAGPFGRFQQAVEPGAEYVLTGDATLAGTNAVQARHALRLVRRGGGGGGGVVP